MNKGFIEQHEEDSDEPRALPTLTAGFKNYVTPQGFSRIRSELLSLIDVERPQVVEIVHWAASNGDRSENGDYIYGKKRLREIDRRIRFLTQRLEMMEVVDPSVHRGTEQIFFGATVTYLQNGGSLRTVTILGVDEVDTSKSEVSWVSPIARTLLKARTGDVLQLMTPLGWVEIEVVNIDYPTPSLTG